MLAAEHPEAGGKIFNVTDGAVHTLNEILAAIAAASGRRVPRWSVPAGLARAGIGCAEDLLRLLGRRPTWGRASVDKFTEDMAVSGARMQNELGFKATMDLQSGWRDALFGWQGK